MLNGFFYTGVSQERDHFILYHGFSEKKRTKLGFRPELIQMFLTKRGKNRLFLDFILWFLRKRAKNWEYICSEGCDLLPASIPVSACEKEVYFFMKEVCVIPSNIAGNLLGRKQNS